MKIKFLENHTGRETAMQLVNEGDVLDIPTAQALELIRLGVAEESVTETIDTPPRYVEGGSKARRKKAGSE